MVLMQKEELMSEYYLNGIFSLRIAPTLFFVGLSIEDDYPIFSYLNIGITLSLPKYLPMKFLYSSTASIGIYTCIVPAKPPP